MPNYEALYYKLFAAMADAVEALEAWNWGQAKEILIRAQQEAEDAVLEDAQRGASGTPPPTFTHSTCWGNVGAVSDRPRASNARPYVNS